VEDSAFLVLSAFVSPAYAPVSDVRVTDRSRYDPTRAALALIAALRAAHPDSFRFRAERFDLLTGDPEVRAALEQGLELAAVWSGWGGALRRFKDRRAKYLLY
jgi:uncharacterized protein YbbC (DUF1343 family)